MGEVLLVRAIETFFQLCGAASIVLGLFVVPAAILLCAGGLQYPTMVDGEPTGNGVEGAPVAAWVSEGEDGEAEASSEGTPGDGSGGELGGDEGDGEWGEGDGPVATARQGRRGPLGSGAGGDPNAHLEAVAAQNAEREARRTSGGGGRRCKDPVEVTRVAPDSYTVAETWVSRNKTTSALVGRLDWHEGGSGKRDGFQLSRIGCGPFHQLGLRDGDVVHAVNGKSIRSLPKAWLVWQSVKRADSLRLEISRNGEARTLRYVVM